MARLGRAARLPWHIPDVGPGYKMNCVQVKPGERFSYNEHTKGLVIIEMQHGAYTGEDDITRLEDGYGPERAP